MTLKFALAAAVTLALAVFAAMACCRTLMPGIPTVMWNQGQSGRAWRALRGLANVRIAPTYLVKIMTGAPQDARICRPCGTA